MMHPSKFESKSGGILGNQKGYILLTTYLLMSAAAVVTLANCMHNSSFTRECERQRNAIVALEMAEGGLDKALVSLTSSSSYAGTSGSTVSLNFGSSRGAYDIAITTPAGAPSNVRKVVVTGHAPDAAAVNSPSTNAENLTYKVATTNVYVSIPSSTNYFTHAAFADGSLQINGGAQTDSYKSSSGAYAAGTARSYGGIGTNSTTAGAININGGTVIKGDANVGVGGNTATVISINGGSSVTGTKSVLSASKTMTVPSIPAGATNLGNLTVNGGATLTLSSGTYRAAKVTVNGGGKIVTSGTVTLYVTDQVQLNGGGIIFQGASSIPGNFKLFMTSSQSISINGGGTMYAAIYAPLSDLQLNGGGVLYGAGIFKTAQINGGAKIHYDEDLGTGGTSSTGGVPSILTWVQTGNSNWTN